MDREKGSNDGLPGRRQYSKRGASYSARPGKREGHAFASPRKNLRQYGKRRARRKKNNEDNQREGEKKSSLGTEKEAESPLHLKSSTAFGGVPRQIREKRGTLFGVCSGKGVKKARGDLLVRDRGERESLLILLAVKGTHLGGLRDRESERREVSKAHPFRVSSREGTILERKSVSTIAARTRAICPQRRRVRGGKEGGRSAAEY